MMEGHSLPVEVAHMMMYAALFWVAHAALHEGGLAWLLGPELMKPLLEDMPPKPSKTEKAQAGDEINYVILSNKASNVNVKLHTTCQDVTMSVLSVYLFCLYTTVLLDPALNADADARLHATSDTSYFAFRLHCASTFYEVLLYLHIGKDWATYLHHGAVLVNYARALTHGRMHFYGAWLGTVEGTNPFLCLTFAMMRCGLKDSKALEYSTLALLVSFLAIRVLSLPGCFATIALDEGAVRLSGPQGAVSFVDNDWWWYQLGRTTIVFLWALSTWWFSKMVRGVLKRLKEKKPASTHKAE